MLLSPCKGQLDLNPTRPISPSPALFQLHFQLRDMKLASPGLRQNQIFSLSLLKPQMQISKPNPVVFLGFLLCISMADQSFCIRIPNRMPDSAAVDDPHRPLKVAVFALGSFWRSEPVFGCLPGVVRTTVGYAGGTKTNPEFRSLGDHAESVQIEYDPKSIQYKELLSVFWSSHDSTQVFGQGPDVGNQYRSIIFTNGSEEGRLAFLSKEWEQTKMRPTIVTTQIQPMGTFYPAESDHQKFELKQNPFLLQLIGNMPDEDLTRSTLATKLNGYSAELCPPKIQREIDAKINDIIRKGWPILRQV